jgi:hypothetical protein
VLVPDVFVQPTVHDDDYYYDYYEERDRQWEEGMEKRRRRDEEEEEERIRQYEEENLMYDNQAGQYFHASPRAHSLCSELIRRKLNELSIRRRHYEEDCRVRDETNRRALEDVHNLCRERDISVFLQRSAKENALRDKEDLVRKEENIRRDAEERHFLQLGENALLTAINLRVPPITLGTFMELFHDSKHPVERALYNTCCDISYEFTVLHAMTDRLRHDNMELNAKQQLTYGINIEHPFFRPHTYMAQRDLHMREFDYVDELDVTGESDKFF